MATKFLNILSSDLTKFLETGEYSDVIIRVGENYYNNDQIKEEKENKVLVKEFKVHSIILRARSNYFLTALSNAWAKTEGDKLIFTKPNISPKAFDIILK